MANYSTLKTAIQAVIKENGNNEITGNILQTALLSMINSLGADYQFAGVATPSTNPGTPDQNVFYIAAIGGTYANMGGLVLSQNEVAVLLYNGTWSKQTTNAASSDMAADASASYYRVRNGYIDGNSQFFSQATSRVISIKTVPGRKYILMCKAVSTTAKYYVFSSDVNCLSPVGTRTQVTTNRTVELTAPADGNYLNVCCVYMGNGSLSDMLVYEKLPYLDDNDLANKYVKAYVSPSLIVNSDNSLCGRIKVEEGKTYAIQYKSTIASLYSVFTSDGEATSGTPYVGSRFSNNEGIKLVTAPAGAKYLFYCLSYQGNGSVDVGTVEEYTLLTKNMAEDIEALKKRFVTIQNLYDYDGVGVVNGVVATYGPIVTNFNGFSTGLIPIKPNHYYYLKRQPGANLSVRCLAADRTTYMKVRIASTGEESTNYYLATSPGGQSTSAQFKTPANAAYFQASLTPLNTTSLGDYYKIMLEDVGESYNPDFVPSPYMPYGEVHTYLKSEFLDMDTTPVNNSGKPITSGGVYDAIGGLGNQLKVLLVGSSHGVNTISMFPALAKNAGIDMVCGNLYTGSATIGAFRDKQIPYIALNNLAFERFCVYENGSWATKATRTLLYALQLHKWDVIILQRGATEDEVWDETKANYFQYLLDYIKDNCDYTPRIYFNSGIADAVNPNPSAGQVPGQIEHTNAIMSSAKQMKAQFGIDIIPTAVAVQYARATCLAFTGYWENQDMASDSQHLDTGVGQYVTGCTVFEKIVKDIKGKSILELAYLPVYADVSGNVVNSGSQYFTAITEYYARIGKRAAILAVQDGEYKADTAAYLTSMFGSLPSTYTITNNLTGCTNTNTDTSISTDSVYLGRLIPDAGKLITDVTVLMGGVDVTASAYFEKYNNGTTDVYCNNVRIGIITGNIVINAVAS